MTTTAPIGFDASLRERLTQDIFVGMGLDSLDDAERQALLDTMLATIKDRVLARVLDELTPAERTELTNLVDADRGTEVSEFLASHVSDLDTLMTQEAVQYKVEMIQNARQIRSLLGESAIEQSTPVADETPTATLPTVVPDDLPVPYVPPALPATQNEAPPALPPLPTAN